MVKSLRYLFLLFFIAVSGAAFAQTGAISGTVKDEKSQPVIGAIIEVLEGGTVRGGAATDEDGKYLVKPLNPGTDYTVTVKYTGYQEQRLTKVQITGDRTTYQNFNLKIVTNEREVVVVKEYKVPLIKKDEPGTTTTLTGDQIAKMATRNTNDFVSLSAGTYQQKSGGGISIGGARSNGTLYIIDGVQVNGANATNFAPGNIDQMSVITSGLPAKYGDALGGVVTITTKGPSPKHQGGVGFEHSVDGYNHNLAYFNLSGPIMKKKVDSTGATKKTVLGYALGGQYLYNGDADPNYYKNYVVKSDVLNQIHQNPLQFNEGSAGTRYSAEDVTFADMETRKSRPNAQTQNARLNGKLDYQVSDNADIVVGGNFSYTKANVYSKSYSLFALDAIPVQNSYTGRAFARFTQRLGKPTYTAPGEEKKQPLISNAFYTVQADYQIDYYNVQSPTLKKNPFEYAYIGKFDQNRINSYTFGYDTVSNSYMILQDAQVDNGLTFQASNLNTNLANYTSQVYDHFGSITNRDELRQLKGLLNGDQPNAVYSTFANSGTTLTGYNYGNTETFSLNLDASFDLHAGKTRHAIEFGMYYQQIAQRSFAFGRGGGSSIWDLMYTDLNAHLGNLDYTNPTYVINGVSYTYDELKSQGITPGPSDTVYYAPRVDTAAETVFSKNLRKALGYKTSDYIYSYSLDPSQLSLSMFSADELLNSGNPFVNYYGYDYTGKRLNGQVNFNDWFTKRDANGNYTREVGAYRPSYMAGYIMDKFELPNNTIFNVGVRVERFDANTKVLKDPYSLYAVETVGSNSIAINDFNGGKNPSNMGSNYVVYVDNNSSNQPHIVGYRNGDDWYDAYGRPLADPSVLRSYSNGNDPQPLLQRNSGGTTARALTMRDSAYNPNSSFTDYTPQVNVMPRMSFTFPIADQSMFYAHYDIIVQRPKSVSQIYATPNDYYYLTQKIGDILPNPNLKPEKLIDYEFGFQQALNTFSAVTVSGFYKERKDMIQVRPYLYAWPQTYYTYGNRDFSTTKGFVFKYDLRRIGHISALITYTLQFAEGTASSANESNGGSTSVSSSGLLQNLIGAGLPYLRFTYPLNIDSRHNINANIDYRYNKGEGPVVGNSHILENAGINLIFRTRSGEPYTRYKYATPGNQTVYGGIQNSRLGWHYMMDLRVDKQFNINFGKKNDATIGARKSLGLMAFIYIQNLLNTRDILAVYGFTGRPDDNGYLSSALGQQTAASQVNQQAFYDQYTIGTNYNQGYINLPRRVNLGIQLNF